MGWLLGLVGVSVLFVLVAVVNRLKLLQKRMRESLQAIAKETALKSELIQANAESADLEAVEKRLSKAHENYATSLLLFNTATEAFPSSRIAKVFGLKAPVAA